MRTHGLTGVVLVGLGVAAGLGLVAAAQGPTAEEIVAACAEAMGGMERVQALKTLRVEVVYPDHGDEPIYSEIKRPNLVRTKVTVFDGTRAAYWKKPPEEGSTVAPELVPEAHLKDFEVDVAWFFPAIFEHNASYLGVQAVDGATCHALKVTLPLGATMTYLIDAETSLISRVDVEVELDGKTYDFSRSFSDYQPVDGLLFPRSFTYPGRQKDTQDATVTSIQLNVPFSDDHFQLPPGLR